MEIIEELEPCRREIYGGAVGYISYTRQHGPGDRHSHQWSRRGAAAPAAGAGIVADSDPAAEYQETVNKALGVKLALEMARAGLD